MEEPQSRISLDKLIAGGALIVFGICWFLGAIDLLHVRETWKLWPLILIVLGLANEAEAIRNRRSDGGWILLAIGVWFLIGNFRLFGMRHGSAMPIAVMIAGAAIALHALIDRPKGEGVEKEMNR